MALPPWFDKLTTGLTRPREVGLAKVLPYWEIRNGLVFLSTGQCEVGLELRLPVTTFASDEDLLRLHGSLLSTLRFAVPEGERLRLFVEVAPLRQRLLEAYQRGFTSTHGVAQRFKEEKMAFLETARRQGELVEVRAYLTCSVLQPGRLKPRRPNTVPSLSPDELAVWERRALSIRTRLTNFLGSAGFGPTPLFDQGLFELLWRYFNPGARLGEVPQYHPPEVYLPHRYVQKEPHRAPPTLRARLAGGDIAHHHWDHLRAGHYAVGAVTMGTLPRGETHVGMAGRLLGLPGLYWLVVDYRHEPQGPTTRALESKARRFTSAEGDTGGFTDHVDASVRTGAAETDEAVLHVTRTGGHLFQIGMTAFLCDRERETLHQNLEVAVSAFASLPGVTPYQEGVALLEQFFALAPFSGRTNEHMHLVLEENAADFVPLSGPWHGADRPTALFLNRWNSLTALDPFDPKAANWNAIVVGGSGSGKTFFTQVLINELFGQTCDVMIVDRGYGYAPLVELYGGAVVSFDAAGGVSLNPFDLPAGQLEPDDTKKGFLLALLRAMVPAENGSEAAVEDALFMAAVQQTYARALSERRDGDGVKKTFSGARLSDLVRVLVTLEEVGERPASRAEKDLARSLALRLQPWTGDTPFGNLLDCESTVLPDASILYFETSGLESYPKLQNVATLLITDAVWRRVKRTPERRKLVVMDEFWSLLKMPQAAAFVVELYRRFRRYNAAAYAVTQSLKDFTEDAAQGILQNTSYHFLLPLPGEAEAVRDLLHLSERAMDAYFGLSTDPRYRELLAWVRRDGKLEGDVLRVVPRPLEYWAFTTNANDVAERDRTLARHDGHWLAALEELAARYPFGTRQGEVGVSEQQEKSSSKRKPKGHSQQI